MSEITQSQREQIMQDFEQALKTELDRRHIPYEDIRLTDASVNLDVSIGHYVGSYFQYMGWGWLVYRRLSVLTMAEFASWYAERYRMYLMRYLQFVLDSPVLDRHKPKALELQAALMAVVK